MFRDVFIFLNREFTCALAKDVQVFLSYQFICAPFVSFLVVTRLVKHSKNIVQTRFRSFIFTNAGYH